LQEVKGKYILRGQGQDPATKKWHEGWKKKKVTGPGETRPGYQEGLNEATISDRAHGAAAKSPQETTELS